MTRLFLYLMPIIFITLGATSIVHIPFGGFDPVDWRYWLFILTGFVSATALSVPIVNQIVTIILSPRVLPRLDFSRGIPDAHRTMVVVPTLVCSIQQIDELIEALEIRYLGNRDSNVFFSLLTDFHDAAECQTPQDEILITYLRSSIQALNERYREDRPGIFFLFHRTRVWNPVEKVWMGHERKRGKLEEFNAMLRDQAQSAFSDCIGDKSILKSVRYVITLDTDTQLPRDSAYYLVGNIAHPLNRPVYDPVKRRIVKGYAILQPRASISLISASQTRFSKLYAGETGIDPYSRQVSDVYQDIFGEGSYIGKGIYDVDAFRQAVDGRFPENLILSHDLLESGYARSALVTDVELIEDHPDSYTVDTSRRHRWTRGDWQLIGWFFPRVPGPTTEKGVNPERQVNSLSPLSVWKLADNLRRSLVPPSLLLLLTGGWLFGPGPVWFWSLIFAMTLFLPIIIEAGIGLILKPDDRGWFKHSELVSKSTIRPVLLAFLNVIFLPYETLMTLNAILHSGIRMLFTRRGLLLWHLPSYAIRNSRRTLSDFISEMWITPVMAITIFTALWQLDVSEWLFCVPVLFLWFVAPFIAWWISIPVASPEKDMSVEQVAFLRTVTRRTWRYFADFVGPQDHWLPPDNFQEASSVGIASRTSPTNIGMALLANLSANDFGYITTGELLRRTELTLSTMEMLDRYHGHFYNWYDTHTLQRLHPHYVSSVDSGNLVGCLLTLQAGLTELKELPVLSANSYQGLLDTLQIVAEHALDQPAPELTTKIRLLQDTLSSFMRNEHQQTLASSVNFLNETHRNAGGLVASLLPETDSESELFYWAQVFDQQLSNLRDELVTLGAFPEQHSQIFNHIPSLVELNRERIDSDTTSETPHYIKAAERLSIIDDLIDRCRQLAEMNFEFLYDTTRGLLAIGYDVGERRRDPSCYDLLASEARLASFLLIAQGTLPQKHWFALGRLLTSHGGHMSLISWSGSMFEYLMPQLIMPGFDNTLLAQTCTAVVSRQIEYGRQRAVPWGISESCYDATDAHHVYQYRAFGVPGLGFKRGLSDDLVIAPYASALALLVMPQEACQNLQRLANEGFLGKYGFYEAIDYTPSRVPPGKQHALVKTFMAHHQGMSLLALEHLLLKQPMQRRFLSDPLMRATQLLLQERIPRLSSTLNPHAIEVNAAAHPSVVETGVTMRVFKNPQTLTPEIQLLSNGAYHVMATHAGGGYSHWRDLAITRWREDATCDCWGTFIYLRERKTGHYWSTAFQPTLHKADHYEAIFVQARAEYRRRDQSIETHTEICVSPEDDVEIRRITFTNQSALQRLIEITSYAEVVLAPMNADLAHRAFSNLFVQTEILPDQHAILCTRRPRTSDEQAPWMFHLLVSPNEVSGKTSYETDRSRFIGRGRSVTNPIVMDSGEHPVLTNTEGSVLDPIVSIRSTIKLLPDESATVQIITGVAETREAALVILEKYTDRHFVERAFELAWFQSKEVLRHLNASEADAQIYARLAGSVIYSNAARRAAADVIRRNVLGQSGLWGFSVSGDHPIVLINIQDRNSIGLIKQILQAHSYWRLHGLIVDLIILNEDFSGYRAVLQDQITGLINAYHDVPVLDKPGGVFLRRSDELSVEQRVLFQSVARVIFNDTTESLINPVERQLPSERLSGRLKTVRQNTEIVHPLPERERIFSNGLGGFTHDGHEYVICLEPGQTTPAPWVNVIASPHIGTVVSESGSAYTWVENAHEFRLTTWHNDPVCDSSGEAMYIRDEDSGAFWSPTPLPTRGRSGYVSRHGFGYSIFEHYEADIASELATYVAMDAPVKFLVLKLNNHSKRQRRLSVTGYWELVLGEWRHANMMHSITETDPLSGALFARNNYGRECANRVFFAQVSEMKRTVTGNRTEFIGRNRSLANPLAMLRERLLGEVGAGLDPCAAIQTDFDLEEGQEREIVFISGAARDKDEARQYIQRFSGTAGARQALDAVWEHWNRTLGAVNIETPDTALNILANGWLVYQTLSCRLWGRSGYYQSGGAYGFRDQLQDTMALIHTTPWLAREQLIRCSRHQFIQGDVQHWWHPPNGQGVRTQFSDDYLWLPYATCRYVMATGDTGVLDESVHFLEGRKLNEDEEAYYDYPQHSQESASHYEHCVRAIKYALRFGEHHLPLMGCGDWNDGMNRVGHKGKGESVWLAWFLYENLKLFAVLASDHGDDVFAEECTTLALQLRINIEASAWDGNWYRRAWFDDGTPLGSAENEECQIDSISQSWSVISGGGNKTRTAKAMAAVNTHLIQRESKVIKLLTPPFDTSNLEPGYIKGYVPGVRENGGQYTHAAIWATMAYAMMGERDRAWELFWILNPINRTSNAADVELYKVEPYVMCADIYAAPPHTGRGGWTWYTGASGWMYRLIVESLLGLQLEVDHLRVEPCIPTHWSTYTVHYRFRETHYHITVRCNGGTSQNISQVTLDNIEVSVVNEDETGRSQGIIPLVDDHLDHVVNIDLI